MKCVSKHQDLQIKQNMSHFQTLGVVGRGSDTQVQVAGNLN